MCVYIHEKRGGGAQGKGPRMRLLSFSQTINVVVYISIGSTTTWQTKCVPIISQIMTPNQLLKTCMLLAWTNFSLSWFQRSNYFFFFFLLLILFYKNYNPPNKKRKKKNNLLNVEALYSSLMRKKKYPSFFFFDR